MAEAPHSSQPGDRPRSVTLVTWGVFLLGIINGWRAYALFQQRGLLLDQGMSLDPAFLAAASVIWSVLLIGVAISIYRRWLAARWITPALLAIYTLYIIVLQGFKIEVPDSASSLTVTNLISVVIVIFIVLVLNRKKARDYFVT